MSEHEALLAALREQTLAFDSLATAITALAESNRELIDAMLGEEDGEAEDQIQLTYMDGTRVDIGGN
jgi:hypothetical protein